MELAAVLAALSDLAAAMESAEWKEDVAGVLAAWYRVASGLETADDRWRPVEPVQPTRSALAVELARRHGAVTSGELAELSGVSTETARLELRRLAATGELQPVGRCRGRRYVIGTYHLTVSAPAAKSEAAAA